MHKRLAPQIAELRATMEVARKAARATYDLAIEPFRQDATTYEEALAAADRLINEEMKPFYDKEEEARLAYNTLCQRQHEGVDEAYRALEEARKARKAAFDQTGKTWSAARDASRAAFSHRRQYDKAGSERDRSLRRANTIFSANVERLYGLLQVEQRFESAMCIMEIWDKPLLSEEEPAQS